MAAAEPFGPFRSDVDPVERVAQLRTLRTLVHVYARDPDVEDALARGESNSRNLPKALEAFDDLPALTRRRILATFAKIRPNTYTRRRKGSSLQEATDDQQVD
jgi:hypothetical protein